MQPTKPIHPFPARMASEIALNALSILPAGSKILDPMVGSGTVLKMASELGLNGIGFDTDPLAVLISKVWTNPLDTDRVKNAARDLDRKLKQKRLKNSLPKWISGDKETKDFVNFWFADSQKYDLARLSSEIFSIDNEAIVDALKVALSRLIITKNRGASLARDISHSRPHRVRSDNEFDILTEFQKSVDFIIQRLKQQSIRNVGKTKIKLGDTRKLRNLKTNSIDFVLTSPPYLNAIDYMRAHKLSLVWLGYTISELRRIRSNNIGAEKSYDSNTNLELVKTLVEGMGDIGMLNLRQQNMIKRYVVDIYQMLVEIQRVLKPNSRAVFVIGNSCLSGIFVRNAQALKNAAEYVGLSLVDEHERELPANRRYLPPPGRQSSAELAKRMRTECVISFIKAT
jgi:DNA modification methylase